MRSLAAFALLSALALAGCSDPCQELGDRLCSCAGGTSAADACKRQVQSDLGRNSPGHATCDQLLASCHEPSGTVFCEWVLTRCGQASCGLSKEETTAPVDAAHPSCSICASPASDPNFATDCPAP